MKHPDLDNYNNAKIENIFNFLKNSQKFFFLFNFLKEFLNLFNLDDNSSSCY